MNDVELTSEEIDHRLRRSAQSPHCKIRKQKSLKQAGTMQKVVDGVGHQSVSSADTPHRDERMITKTLLYPDCCDGFCAVIQYRSGFTVAEKLKKPQGAPIHC
jgi:hypothetical protein